MGFLKLLNVGLILITRTVFCIDDNLEILRLLPRTTIPLHYEINLTVYLEEGNFYGESNVNVEIYQNLSEISLHSRELEINQTATTLINGKGTVYKPKEHIHNNATNILTLNFDNTLSYGHYILNMKFAGNLSTYLPETNLRQRGFIKLSYINNENITWLATTLFEPNGARRMFPCWDEPALKATFDISITHPKKYGVLSNMPIREQILERDDMVRTHFNTTPKMSTYLVAIVMSDFVRVPNANETINMWCKSSLTFKVKFAYSVAEQVTSFLLYYTNTSMRMPKIDHVLIPNFLLSGMENWGLITYRESNLIYDSSSDSISKKIDIATLITHELAHQWFGNLVTPSWWSYLWLKEGFATFFESLIINQVFQNWQTMNFIAFQQMQECFLRDIDTLKPVTLTISNTLEDVSLFSIEVYKKAPVLLRMLYNAITARVFRQGLITYLNRHQFSSATPDDLWSAMQSALGESDVPNKDYIIKEVMDTWMNQERYPFILVERNYETGEVTISQVNILNNDEDKNKITKWWIPITFATQSNPDFINTVPRYWLSARENNITFTIDLNDWIIINVQQTGYYRVTYDVNNWEKISHYLNGYNKEYNKIHVLNRAQIIIDSFTMLSAGRINGSLFISLISYLSRETDLVPWQSLFQITESMSRLFLLPEMKHIKTRIGKLLDKLLQYLGYVENFHDDNITKLTRLNAMKWACILGNAGCKENAAVKLSEHLADPHTHKISRQQRFMYCAGMMAANRTTWNKMLELYLKTDLKQKKYTKSLLKGLACAENPDIIINYLNIVALNTSLFHHNEHALVFKYIIEYHARNDRILDYILQNLNIIKPRLFVTVEVIKFILENVYSIHQIQKVKNFSSSNFKRDTDTLFLVIKLVEMSTNSLNKNIEYIRQKFYY